jgi:hypothetical protein
MNIVEDQFPGATQIVDRYHAKEHLSAVRKALYGAASPRAAQWSERRKQELDTGRFRALLQAIRRQTPRPIPREQKHALAFAPRLIIQLSGGYQISTAEVASSSLVVPAKLPSPAPHCIPNLS